MSTRSELFFSTNPDKSTLHRRITPSDEQRALQQERWNHLMDYFKEDLKERTGCEVESWLQGSYKFGTQIRPHVLGGQFDIDLGVYFNWKKDEEGEKYSPQDLKSIVQQSLFKYVEILGPEEDAEVLRPSKKKCARITFLDNFHIDVPAYHQDTNTDARVLATEDHGWEYSDPRDIYNWFKDQVSDDDMRAVLRRLIRYLKMWAALNLEKEDRPSSIMLTVLATDAFKKADTRAGDEFILLECVKHIIDALEASAGVFNPVNREENLNQLSRASYDSFHAQLQNLLRVAESALASSTIFEAATIWQKAFKQFIPLPDDEKKEISTAIVPAVFVPDVRIQARSQTNRHYAKSWNNEVTSVPRDCTLLFTLMNAGELPEGAEIEWWVRNEGEEAEYVNDLGHYSGKKTTAKDSTSYHGRHHMDLTIKSISGEIIGFRRIPVYVEEALVPPRNPANKPSYTLLRRRKRR